MVRRRSLQRAGGCQLGLPAISLQQSASRQHAFLRTVLQIPNLRYSPAAHVAHAVEGGSSAKQ